MAMLQAVWRFISATPAIVPLVLLPFGAWLASRAWQLPMVQQAGRWAGGAVLVFGVLDWVLLSGLPHLGLSFGPVGLPLLGITAVRLVFVVVLARIWRWSRHRWPMIGGGQKLAIGLALVGLSNLCLSVCAFEGLYVEPFRLQVTGVQVTGPGFLLSRPLRIVQISDLHVERITKREKELIELVSDLEPDMIVLTGDYLNTSYLDDPVARRDARNLIARLYAPYGVYAVTARTVDTTDAIQELFGGLDVVVLHDQVHRLSFEGGDLYVVGVSYLDRRRDETALSGLMEQVPGDAYSLLLYHTPDLVRAASEEGVDLYLGGHTHGGQIRLPLLGAVFTASAYGKRYEQGYYSLGDTTLYVSRGIGMEGMGAPRARFLCPPEIVVVSLGDGESR
jgi:predicted MPP superfamily phosphohydrolase